MVHLNAANYPSSVFRRGLTQTTDAAFGYGGERAAGYRCSLSQSHIKELTVVIFYCSNGLRIWEVKWPVCLRGSHAVIGKQISVPSQMYCGHQSRYIDIFCSNCR